MDITAIAAGISSLKTAGDIAKAMLGLKVSEDVRAQVIELQTAIMAAQSGALGAQGEMFALINRVRQLESEIAAVRAWEDEKARYQLKMFETESFAYVLKESAANGEPIHYACANCFQQGHKSILQVRSRLRNSRTYECQRCAKVVHLKFADPEPPRPPQDLNPYWERR